MYDNAVLDPAFQQYHNGQAQLGTLKQGPNLGHSNIAWTASQGHAVLTKETTLLDLLQRTEQKAAAIKFRLQNLRDTLFGQEILSGEDVCNSANVRPINDIVGSTLNHVDDANAILDSIERKIGGRS